MTKKSTKKAIQPKMSILLIDPWEYKGKFIPKKYVQARINRSQLKKCTIKDLNNHLQTNKQSQQYIKKLAETASTREEKHLYNILLGEKTREHHTIKAVIADKTGKRHYL